MTDFPKKPHAIRLRNEALILKCATSFVTSVTHQCVSQVKWAQLQTEAGEASQAIW